MAILMMTFPLNDYGPADEDADAKKEAKKGKKEWRELCFHPYNILLLGSHWSSSLPLLQVKYGKRSP